MSTSLLVRPKAGSRPLWLFASLWTLRRYPSLRREWSWGRKFAAIWAAGFEGVFSPPLPVLAERGALRYLGVTSLGKGAAVEPALRAIKELGALAVDIQLGDYDTPLPDAVKLARRIGAVARELDLPFAIETHRDTFTETPEATLALSRAYRKATGAILPLCLDHSHFAVVRHLAPGTFWERLSSPSELLASAVQFHLRPFNGHHCQIPVLAANGRRTPEYRDWQAKAKAHDARISGAGVGPRCAGLRFELFRRHLAGRPDRGGRPAPAMARRRRLTFHFVSNAIALFA